MLANLTTIFNQLLTSLLLFLWSFWPYKPIIKTQMVIPNVQMENPASTSAIVSLPALPRRSASEGGSIPWGTTDKLGPGLYRTYVANDEKMGTSDEILAALNLYRKNHHVGAVRTDENICKLAQSRAATQNNTGALDGHKGLIDYMNDPKHWQELDITGIGENASYGYILSGTHLIEWVFDSDIEHKENQLNPNWNLACAGISGVTVDIIFGKR